METPERLAYDDPRVRARIVMEGDEPTAVGLERQEEISTTPLIPENSTNSQTASRCGYWNECTGINS